MIQLFDTRLELYEAIIPKGTVGAELGVADGTNAKDLLSIVKPERLFLVDPWPDHYIDAPKNLQKVSEDFYDLPGVSVHRERDHDWLMSVGDGSLDWVYLDTDHTYETTKRELALLRTKVKSIVAGHDFCCTSPVLGPIVQNWRGGVMRAVLEAVSYGWLECIALTAPKEGCSAMDMYPSWACRVK